MAKKSQFDTFTEKRIFKHNERVERRIALDYAQVLKEAKARLADLYATLGPNPTIEEARRYKRLQNLVAAISAEYKKLGAKALNETLNLSATNYTEAFFGNMWGAEQTVGTFKWKNPNVEAIRASVFWEGTGLDAPKRFGKNIQTELTNIEAAITRGLATGQNYAKTASSLADQFTKGYNDALRVIRTESTRNRAEGFNAAFETITDAGIDARKVWIATNDDRTRSDHAVMDGQESDKAGMFTMPDGNETAGPGLSGDPSFDINCRCTLGTVFADERAPGTSVRMTPKETAESWNKWATGLGWSESDGWAKATQALM